jgi:hypothetical protein
MEATRFEEQDRAKNPLLSMLQMNLSEGEQPLIDNATSSRAGYLPRAGLSSTTTPALLLLFAGLMRNWRNSQLRSTHPTPDQAIPQLPRRGQFKLAQRQAMQIHV